MVHLCTYFQRKYFWVVYRHDDTLLPWLIRHRYCDLWQWYPPPQQHKTTLKITGSGCATFFAPTEAAVRVSFHDGEVWFVPLWCVLWCCATRCCVGAWQWQMTGVMSDDRRNQLCESRHIMPHKKMWNDIVYRHDDTGYRHDDTRLILFSRKIGT